MKNTSKIYVLLALLLALTQIGCSGFNARNNASENGGGLIPSETENPGGDPNCQDEDCNDEGDDKNEDDDSSDDDKDRDKDQDPKDKDKDKNYGEHPKDKDRSKKYCWYPGEFPKKESPHDHDGESEENVSNHETKYDDENLVASSDHFKKHLKDKYRKYKEKYKDRKRKDKDKKKRRKYCRKYSGDRKFGIIFGHIKDKTELISKETEEKIIELIEKAKTGSSIHVTMKRLSQKIVEALKKREAQGVDIYVSEDDTLAEKEILLSQLEDGREYVVIQADESSESTGQGTVSEVLTVQEDRDLFETLRSLWN